jgi:hypothetical protein
MSRLADLLTKIHELNPTERTFAPPCRTIPTQTSRCRKGHRTVCPPAQRLWRVDAQSVQANKIVEKLVKL